MKNFDPPHAKPEGLASASALRPLRRTRRTMAEILAENSIRNQHNSSIVRNHPENRTAADAFSDEPQSSAGAAFDIENLPDVLFLRICDLLNDSALIRFCLTSRTIHDRVMLAAMSSWIWRRRAERTPFVIGGTDSRSHLERYQSARKWHHNLYDRCWLLRFNRQIPSLCLDESSGEILISFENRIMITQYNTPIPDHHMHTHHIRHGARLQSHTGDDISRFAMSNRHVFAGTAGGDILVWKRRSGAQTFTCPFLPHSFVAKAHMTDIHMLDAANMPHSQQVFVSTAAKEGTCALWQQQPDHRLGMQPVQRWALGDRVWSTRIHPGTSTVAAGTACLSPHRTPIVLYDMETGTAQPLGADSRRGAGVLDVQFSSDGRLLYSCGYDSAVRLWDRRTEQCTWHWDEPFDSVLYSLSRYDDHCLLIGSGRHSVIWLLDTRFMRRARKGLYISRRNSPVYAVGLLPRSIFAAVDAGVRHVSVDGVAAGVVSAAGD